jgi:hypothetical protein
MLPAKFIGQSEQDVVRSLAEADRDAACAARGSLACCRTPLGPQHHKDVPSTSVTMRVASAAVPNPFDVTFELLELHK